MKILFVLVQVLATVSFTGSVEKILQDDLVYVTEADYPSQNNTVVLIQSSMDIEFSEFAVTSLTEEVKRNLEKTYIYAALLDTFVPNNPVPY